MLEWVAAQPGHSTYKYKVSFGHQITEDCLHFNGFHSRAELGCRNVSGAVADLVSLGPAPS